jgi:hypothetical protein
MISVSTVKGSVGNNSFDYGFEIKIFKKNDQLYFRAIYPEYDMPLIPISENELFNRFYWDSLIFLRDKTRRINHIHWNGSHDSKAGRMGD